MHWSAECGVPQKYPYYIDMRYACRVYPLPLGSWRLHRATRRGRLYPLRPVYLSVVAGSQRSLIKRVTLELARRGIC